MKTHHWLIALLLTGCEGRGVPGAMNPPREEPATPAEQPTLKPAPRPEPGMNPPTPPEPSTPPADPSLTAEQQLAFDAAKNEQLDRLEEMVGQFVSGRSPVYRGSFNAADNYGVLRGQTNGVFPDGAVIAAMETRDDLYQWKDSTRKTPGRRLSLVSEAQSKQFEFMQYDAEPGVTHFSWVLELNTCCGATARCTDCVGAFDAAQATLAVSGSATEDLGNDTTMKVTASGSLSKISPDQLSFQDLLALSWVQYPRHEELLMFVSLGGGPERTRQVTGSHLAAAEVPNGTAYHHCERTTSYQVEVYVNEVELASFGVRNFTVQSEQTCCYLEPNPSCEPPACF